MYGYPMSMQMHCISRTMNTEKLFHPWSMLESGVSWMNTQVNYGLSLRSEWTQSLGVNQNCAYDLYYYYVLCMIHAISSLNMSNVWYLCKFKEHEL